MNTRNVEALADELSRMVCDLPLSALPTLAAGKNPQDAYREWATKLAARGVLVPSSLSDDDVFRAAADRGQLRSEAEPEHLAWVRAELERIARGES